jgi:hypothetical protein
VPEPISPRAAPAPTASAPVGPPLGRSAPAWAFAAASASAPEASPSAAGRASRLFR